MVARKLEEKAEIMHRFQGHVSDLNLQRRKNDKRLDKKFSDIDTRNSKRRQSLSFQQEL